MSRFASEARDEPNIDTHAYYAKARNGFVRKTHVEHKFGMPAFYATEYNPFLPGTRDEPKIDMINLPAYSATGCAKDDIANIAVHAFADIYNYRCATPRMWKTFTRKVIVERQIIASATANINSIMTASSPIDLEVSSNQIDHAIWMLLTKVSKLEDEIDRTAAYHDVIGEIDRTASYVIGEIDRTAAYVMMDLLHPLKSDTLIYGGYSLLYRTLCFSDFKLGVELFETILLRNDQRFRPSELHDTEVIRKFERRYKTKLADKFIATTLLQV